MLSSLKPKWHFSEEMEKAMMLFLGQKPQQTNLYIIQIEFVHYYPVFPIILTPIDFAWAFAWADG